MISFRLYDRNGTTLLGLLAEPTSWSVSTEFNEVGALTLEYPAEGINASQIAEMREIAVVDASGTEYTNARYVITGIDTDRTSATGNINITAKSILYRLDTALAYPTGGIVSGEVSRYFDVVSAGFVLKTLIDDAKNRGALSGITYTFTQSVDSNGQAWGDTVTQEYPARTTILSVLRSLSDLGLVEVQTDARVLKATKPDGIGTDRTVGATPIVLRYGHNITEAPEQVSAEKLASVALVEGDEGLIVERSNSAALSTYGRIETSFTASGIDDAAVVSSVGDAYLDTVAGASRQLTVGLALHDGAPMPLKDFTVGDYVYTATSTGLERVRVRQITLSMSGGAISASATLGDRIYEAEIRNARRLSGITSGSVSLGNGTLPTSTPTVVVDTIAPAAPTSLTGTAASYLDGNQIRGRVNLSWTAPTLNADGSALNDLRQYEVEFRQLTTDPWQYGGATSSTAFTVSNLTKSTQYRFRVTAVDSSNNRSAYSNVFIVSTPGFVELPTQPSTPVLTTRLGVLTVDWDGLNYIGGAMSIDTDYVAIHVGTTAGFTPSASNYKGRVYGPDQFHITGLDYATTYHVKLVAYSTSGVNSPTSNSASATIASLVNTDIIANTINGAKILNGSITASDKIFAGSITTGLIEALAITAGKLAVNAVTADKIEAGAVTAVKIDATAIDGKTITGSTVRTSSSSSRVEMNASGLFVYSGGTPVVSLNASGSASFTGTINSTSGTIGGFTVGSTFLSGSGNFRINSDTGNAAFNALTSNGSMLVNAGIVLASGTSTVSAGGNTFNNVGNMNIPSGTLTLTSGNLSVGGSATVSGQFTATDAGTNTNTNTPNAWLSSSGILRRSTSSSTRYKEDIVDLVDVSELDPKNLYDLPVRAFRYKPEHLSAEDDRAGVLMPGFIAEEVDAVYPIAADYEDGPESWNDRMIVPALLSLIQDLNTRVAQLEAGN